MQTFLAFLVGAPGGEELLLIFVVVLSMFGPKKIPEIARNIGKAMEYLRRTSQEFREQLMHLDDEVPKAFDSDVKTQTPSTTVAGEQSDPPPITPGIDPYFPNHDPYNLYSEQTVAEGGMAEPEPLTTGEYPAPAKPEAAPVETAAPEAAPVEPPAPVAVQQQLELLDGQTDQTTESIQEGVKGTVDGSTPESTRAG